MSRAVRRIRGYVRRYVLHIGTLVQGPRPSIDRQPLSPNRLSRFPPRPSPTSPYESLHTTGTAVQAAVCAYVINPPARTSYHVWEHENVWPREDGQDCDDRFGGAPHPGARGVPLPVVRQEQHRGRGEGPCQHHVGQEHGGLVGQHHLVWGAEAGLHVLWPRVALLALRDVVLPRGSLSARLQNDMYHVYISRSDTKAEYKMTCTMCTVHVPV